ncbi:TrkH family potassium uptake protein [Ruminococcus sp.]|uniref:TrkH family potassium uptake protein n=1 Tax=Ruminococcus sp. TaxID=41978 RepID=UPI002E81A1DD|nr:potassium transporter TrkG [Ruminococcus sp.]MEE3492785.1 potassium transporter TrkG [Ruminococcus sp.]
MTRPIKKKKRLSSFQIIILGFVGVILLGALLLMLPISSQDRVVTPFNQTLFTSTSAVCVTGLIVQDTATHWSLFGQIIILALIQVGGLGVITMAASFVLLSGKRFSFSQRNTMQNAISAPSLGGIVRLTKFVVKGTAIIEVTGAVIMMPVFVQSHGARGVWMAIFHSVSAFCNAGFDLMGTPDRKFASLTALSDHPVVNIVIMLLIIIGGIGFMTWRDVITNKFRFKRYRLQSKIVIVTSAILIAIPALLYFFHDFAQLPIAQRIFGSLFQAVTPRTAGFNTLDLNSMSKFGLAVMIILMLIGGSPGSTAGGMKTVTVAVLFKNAIASFKRKEDPECFGRRIESGTVKTATTLFLMYFTLCFFSAAVISMVEDLPFGVCIFETASAVGTVGLTLGITPGLGVTSQVILILLMFLGRVGGLTIIYAALSGSTKKLTKLPKESITVG